MELWIYTKQEENDPAEKTVIPNSWRVSIDSTNSLFPNKFISRRNDPIQRNIMGIAGDHIDDLLVKANSLSVSSMQQITTISIG